MSDATLVFDPYGNVDWETVGHYKTQFHTHSHKTDEKGPHDVIDFYVEDEDFEIFVMGENQVMFWPWTEGSQFDGESWVEPSAEDRDAVEMGVIAIPGAEQINTEHVHTLFTDEIGPQELDNREDAVSKPLDHGGLTIYAHTDRYGNPVQFDRYNDEIEAYYDDGLIGLECYNKDASGGDKDARTWDWINTVHAPERVFFGFGADDANNYNIGSDVLRRWTTTLLDPSDYDPENQEASRDAVREAFVSGEVFAHRRDAWSEGDDPRPQPPTVNSIDVNESEQTITINADGYDRILWISDRGKVIHEGETLDWGETPVGSFARARIRSNPNAETTTQPWGFEPSELFAETVDGDLIAADGFDTVEEFDGLRKVDSAGRCSCAGDLDDTTDTTSLDSDGNITTEGHFKEGQ